MHFYQYSVGGWDGHRSYELSHVECFSEEGFAAICQSAEAEAAADWRVEELPIHLATLRRIIDSERDGTDGEIARRRARQEEWKAARERNGGTYSEIFPRTIAALLRRGFSPVEYAATRFCEEDEPARPLPTPSTP